MGTHEVASLASVTVQYPSPQGTVTALDGVDVGFAKGTSTAIVGRSGSGKSTLISVLSLLRRPTTGQVIVGGVDVSGLPPRRQADLRSRAIGIVFQSFHLDPSMSAVHNVMLPWFFARRGVARRAARARAVDILDRLGIGELADRRPNQMSGGQRQRVAIGRALFPEPTLFVADEPTGNLDEDTANAVADTILTLTTDFGTSVVVVTHDRIIADRAQRQLELVRGRLQAPSKGAT